MSDYTPLKYGYDQAYIAKLSKLLAASSGTIKAASVSKAIFRDGWDDLELKDRMSRITEVVIEHLPSRFSDAIKVLDKVAPEFESYLAMFFPDIVEKLAFRDVEKNWSAAMKALARYTRYCSSEFAVRPFIVADQKRMLDQMLVWAKDKNEHVRRLASEGCRPRLPWAMALRELKANPKPILPILKLLKNDPSEYVRRSVANNLNDISKDHPKEALKLAQAFLKPKSCTDETRKLVKHACRTLLKAGVTEALTMFGYGAPGALKIAKLKLENSKIRIGDNLNFSFDLKSAEALGKIRLEYIVEYVKKNGKVSPKVFQLSEFESDESQRHFQRKQSFKNLSTRKHYAGTHQLAIIVNGVEKKRVKFELGGA